MPTLKARTNRQKRADRKRRAEATRARQKWSDVYSKEGARVRAMMDIVWEQATAMSEPKITTKDHGDGTYTHVFDFTGGTGHEDK